MTQRNKHNECVRLMSLKPSLIGLTDIVLSTRESNLFNEKNQLIRQPDGLAFDYKNKIIYNIEFKCNNTKSSREHAIYQLKQVAQYLHNIFYGWKTTNIYVSEDYKMEVIQ